MHNSALLEQPGDELLRTHAETLAFDAEAFAGLVDELKGVGALVEADLDQRADYKGSRATDASNQIKVSD